MAIALQRQLGFHNYVVSPHQRYNHLQSLELYQDLRESVQYRRNLEGKVILIKNSFLLKVLMHIQDNTYPVGDTSCFIDYQASRST